MNAPAADLDTSVSLAPVLRRASTPAISTGVNATWNTVMLAVHCAWNERVMLPEDLSRLSCVGQFESAKTILQSVCSRHFHPIPLPLNTFADSQS